MYVHPCISCGRGCERGAYISALKSSLWRGKQLFLGIREFRKSQEEEHLNSVLYVEEYLTCFEGGKEEERCFRKEKSICLFKKKYSPFFYRTVNYVAKHAGNSKNKGLKSS